MNALVKTTLAALIVAGAAACGGGGGAVDAAPPTPDTTPEPDGRVTPGACDPTVAGTICTIVGNGESGYSGEEGPALEARMSLPQEVLKHPDGTLYISDWNNHRIRSLTADGVIHHVAGRGELSGTGDDPSNTDLNHPTGMLLDTDGTTMLIAAWHNSQIRELDLTTGEIVNTCGDGRRAFFGEGMAALGASLDLPASIAWDPDHNLVVMDQANQVLRRIDTVTGNIQRIAGRCVIDSAVACADGVEPVTCPGAGAGKTTCGVPATECSKPCTPSYAAGTVDTFRMAQPFGQSADPAGRIVYDGAGNLYFADTSNAIIRMIDGDGNVSIVAGVEPVAGAPQKGTSPDGTVATEALLNNPVDLAIAPDGVLYFTDTYNHCVRSVVPGTGGGAATIQTVAGVCGTAGFDGDGTDPKAAHLKRPYGIELAGNQLYIADTGNNVIRVVNLR